MYVTQTETDVFRKEAKNNKIDFAKTLHILQVCLDRIYVELFSISYRKENAA